MTPDGGAVGTAGDEEELDLEPRRRFPRWLGVLAGAAVVAAAVVALAVHGTGGTKHPAASSSATPRSDGSAQALVAVAARGQFVDLVAGRLQVLRPDASVVRRSATVHAITKLSDAVQLDVDDSTATVWVVPVHNNSAGYAEAYSLKTLHRTRRVRLTAPVGRSAALDGRLYTSPTEGTAVSVLEPGARAFAPTAARQVLAFAADPSRHRLLLLVFDPNAAINATAMTDTTLAKVVQPVEGNPMDVTVVAGSIWVAAYPRLVQLDPVTFTQRGNAFVPRAVDFVRFDNAGDSSLLIRSGDSEDQLSCIDAGTGQQRQYWPAAPVTAAATRGHVLVAPLLGPPHELPVDGCAG